MRQSKLLVVLLLFGLVAAMAAKNWLAPLPGLRPLPEEGRFNAQRAASRLGVILGDEQPHPTDTAANDAVRERLVMILSQIGLKPEVRDAVACNEFHKAPGVSCARVRNVVATIGPAQGRHLLLAAHYDSTPVGPGAGDDGIGVATLLEVAEQLKDRPLKRPVTFLFDEGEELGLIGARAFLADPLSKQVDSLINLEARGVTGPVTMFETNEPNGAAIKLYSKAVDTPAAGSLATDIYRLMPNATDVTTFAERGWLTLNLAITGNETRYHSAGDNLAALDLRSLQMMGDQTLALASELSKGTPPPAGRKIFMDLWGTELIILPLAVGIALLAAAIGGLGWFAWKRQSFGRPLGTVVAAMLLSAALAWLAQQLMGVLRPGTYWRAFPIAAFLAAYATAIAASLAMLGTLGRGIDEERLRSAYWLFFVILGAILALVAPGGIIYFLFPPLVVLAGMVMREKGERNERLAGLAATLILFLTLGATLAQLEQLVTDGPLWIFAPLGALILLPAMIEARPQLAGLSGRAAAIGAALLVVAAWAATSLVPAYSTDRQQRFSLSHFTDTAEGRTYWSVFNDKAPLPPAFKAAGDWSWAAPPHSEAKRWLAPAPPAPEVAAPSLDLLSTGPVPNGRRVTLRFRANGSTAVALIAPKGANVRAAGTTGFVRPVRADKSKRTILRCSGRSCDGLVMDIVLGDAKPVEFVVIGSRPGLPPAGAALANARPPFARPQYAADETVALTRVKL